MDGASRTCCRIIVMPTGSNLQTMCTSAMCLMAHRCRRNCTQQYSLSTERIHCCVHACCALSLPSQVYQHRLSVRFLCSHFEKHGIQYCKKRQLQVSYEQIRSSTILQGPPVSPQYYLIGKTLPNHNAKHVQMVRQAPVTPRTYRTHGIDDFLKRY